YFRRLFKQVTGYTPVNYINRVKIDKAKDLLLSGECNVSEAAEAVGIDNVFYFSRLFKRISSVNPSEYIRR
ncbi:MAG: helix-turn-helix domain-containing protein, partial [Spirochaetota bacterium]